MVQSMVTLRAKRMAAKEHKEHKKGRPSLVSYSKNMSKNATWPTTFYHVEPRRTW